MNGKTMSFGMTAEASVHLREREGLRLPGLKAKWAVGLAGRHLSPSLLQQEPAWELAFKCCTRGDQTALAELRKPRLPVLA